MKEVNQKDKIAIFEEMEQRLLCAEKDLKEVKRFGKRLKEINKNLRKLANYYHTEWLEDMEAYNADNKTKENYRMMGEDAIWNVTQEHYEHKLHLLKTLINAVNKGI